VGEQLGKSKGGKKGGKHPEKGGKLGVFLIPWLRSAARQIFARPSHLDNFLINFHKKRINRKERVVAQKN